MPSVPFGDREILDVVFLVLYVLQLPISLFIYVRMIKYGYGWQSGYFSLIILSALRIASFIAGLVFYGSSYTNIAAVTTHIALLEAGFFAFLNLGFRLVELWMKHNIDVLPIPHVFPPLMGYLAFITWASLILVIAGAVTYSSDNSPSQVSTGRTILRVGVCLFFALAVLLVLFIIGCIIISRKRSWILTTLGLAIPCLLVRGIYPIMSDFFTKYSIVNFSLNIGYIAGMLVVPEYLMVILFDVLGLHLVRNAKYSNLPTDASGRPMPDWFSRNTPKKSQAAGSSTNVEAGETRYGYGGMQMQEGQLRTEPPARQNRSSTARVLRHVPILGIFVRIWQDRT